MWCKCFLFYNVLVVRVCLISFVCLKFDLVFIVIFIKLMKRNYLEILAMILICIHFLCTLFE